jgi:phosphatidate cytidylyltransferase
MATANIAITLLGTLYIGWLFSYLVLLRALTPHGAFLFLLMFTVWANDTVAYFFGKKFGRTQLSPYISPKKTVSGAVAGFLAALAVGYVFGMIFEKTFVPVNWPHYLIMGALIGIIGQISDLSESLIKRDAGVKDSSNLVPGHGGVLDRMDSFIFTAPVLYYYLTWFVLK